MARSIYTKYGDQGQTGLLYGGRMSKADPRAEAYGTVDEAVSALGFAKALIADPLICEAIDALQRSLFTVGAELATDVAERDKLLQHFSAVTPQMTLDIEKQIDALIEAKPLPKAFVIPGGTPGSAALDLARSILRRAERRAVALTEQSLLRSPDLLQFLNRASDFLFVLARAAEPEESSGS